MELPVPQLDPLSMVREFQANYVNIRSLLMAGTGVPAGTRVGTPADIVIERLDLPPALTAAMAEYQANNPEVKSLTPVKYMRTTNGNPDLVVEDDSPLPAEDAVVTFSFTLSTVSAKVVNIVSHVLVATTASDSTGSTLPVA